MLSTDQKKGQRRVNIGELEREFVLECQNRAMGNGWKEVLAMARQGCVERGLPQRVVQIYLEAPEQSVINRLKNVLKKELANSSAAVPSTSTSKPIQSNLMKYATKDTPAQRQTRNKLIEEFMLSSSDSDDSDASESAEPKKKKKKSDRDVAREAQEAHKQMCNKAMETMERVNLLLSNVEKQINKGNSN